jgi:hypothetical protein
MKSARILIEVVAGIIPGTPIPEHTKKFAITSDVWYAEGEYENRKEEAKMEVLKVYGLAQEYMRNLMNPQALNWVRLDWIYL